MLTLFFLLKNLNVGFIKAQFLDLRLQKKYNFYPEKGYYICKLHKTINEYPSIFNLK